MQKGEMQMKKIALVLAAGIIAAGTAFADHPDDETGIGFVLNTGYGDKGFVLNPGLCLKVKGLPVFWGLFLQPSFGDDKFTGIGITGDYYFFEKNFRNETLTNEDGNYNLRIDWYAGVGGFADFLFREGNRNSATFGVRIPAGLSWHIVRQAELAIGIVPQFGIGNNRPFDAKAVEVHGVNVSPGYYFRWAINAELALRYWISPASKQKTDSGRTQTGTDNDSGNPENATAETPEENA
jgi:hypothetical protein